MRAAFVVGVAVAACLLPRVSWAQATETLEAGARITKVDGKRITIEHGAKAGIKMGAVGDVFPVRAHEGTTGVAVDRDVRLAVARVAEVKDDTTTWTTEAIAGPIEVGAYLSFPLSVPPDVALLPLARVLARGIVLVSMVDDQPFTTLEQLLADRSRAASDAALDKMIAELKGLRRFVIDAYPDAPATGFYRGKKSGAIVDGLDRAQIQAFLEYLDAFALTYMGQRWKIPDMFINWVYAGTPSGEKYRRSFALRPLLKKALGALTAGKLDDARAHYATLLKEWAEAPGSVETLARIDRALLLRRAVAADPDDTGSAFALMDELYLLGANEAALALVAPLEKREFDGVKLQRERGLILVEMKRWPAAKAVFEVLAKTLPADTEIAAWTQLARAQAKVATAPTDAGAQLALATLLVEREEWDDAVAAYRTVLDGKTATAKQREAAAKGQEGVSIGKQLELLLRWTLEEIEEHDIAAARARIVAMLGLADRLADRTRTSSVFRQLAEGARRYDEQELAIELMRKRIERAPDDQTAYTALAFALLETDRLDDAEATAKQALGKKGGDPLYANLILAQAARMRGELGDAEKLATKAATARTYGWPRIVLARTDAARGDWEEANTTARNALELDSIEEMRATVTATARGLQASEALRADPKSPRERLRLTRALADLGLVKQVKAEIAKLPKDAALRSEAWWALAATKDPRVLLRDRVAAGREAKPSQPQRKRLLARLEAQEIVRAKPGDDATRVALAKLHVQDGRHHLALATLGPLLAKQPTPPAVDAVAHDARTSIPLDGQMQIGWGALGRNELDTAIRIALAAQDIYDRTGAPAGRRAARQLRSEALGFQGKYPEAIKLLEEARAIALADGDVLEVSVIERQIASHRASTGTNAELAAALERSRKLCAELDDERCLHIAHNQLASLERDEGHSAAALDHARMAWNFAERLGRPDFARAARLELALTSLEANRIADGEQVATKLLADSRAAGDLVFEQAATMLIGAVAMLRGDGPTARGRYLEVYNLGTRYGLSAWRAIARRFEGLAWLEADHLPAKAAIAFEQAAELYTQSASGSAVSERGTSLRRLADARLQLGDLPGARRAAEEGVALAQKFGRRLQLSTANWLLALVALGEGKPDEAVKRAKDAVAIAEKTDSVTVLWNAYYVLGRAYEMKKQDKDALAAYEHAMGFLSNALLAAGADSERTGYMNTGRVREVYRNSVELLLKLGMTTRAMEVLEISRDAMLKQSFDATEVASPNAAVQALLDKYEAARGRVNGLQKQLDKAAEKQSAAQVKALGEQIAKARGDLNDAALQLKITHRELFQALSMAPQELVARSAALPAGTVVVQYFVANDALTIFVISPKLKDPAIVRVKVTATDLARTIDEYRDALITEQERIKERDKVEQLGRKLEGWLLEPLRTHLKDAKTVVIVPFGPLYYVPFDALVTSDANKPLRYALEDYRFAVQTTWTLETLMKPARKRSTGRMLAIANPDGTLPGAQREVSRIMKTAVPNLQVLDKKTGTVEKVTALAGTSRYLHFATHGILDADSRKSYLKLSDGQLTVREIAALKGLRTNNDLVVLSACDTATELRDSAGDEVVSLASSFSLAGAPAVVASLWEISDDSTAELMATFYRALEARKVDRLDALRDAKLNLLRLEKGKDRPYASPWHWASFQLYGDFRAPP